MDNTDFDFDGNGCARRLAVALASVALAIVYTAVAFFVASAKTGSATGWMLLR